MSPLNQRSKAKLEYIYPIGRLKSQYSIVKMNTMKTRNFFLLLMFILPTLSFAGEIYGTLKKDGKPLAGTEIKVMQGDKEFGTVKTDENGYFSITIKQVGAFKLQVVGYDGATFDVFSTNNATAYTLSLTKVGDKWQLKKQ